MTESAEVECVVVGAGAVGLAVARALARAGREVVVLERADAIGSGISARNSEVIHGGIYYPAGSLKARLCVEGRRMLYDYLERHGLAHRRCGKLIVANGTAQEAELERLAERGRENGVEGLAALTSAQARALEPALRCTAALASPETGILDAHGFMLSLRGEIEDAGGAIALASPLVGAEAEAEGFTLHVGGAAPMRLRARMLVNSAGLSAPAVAARIEGLGVKHVPQAHYAKGNYFSLAGATPFSHLIYPIPEAAGLGVHLTLDLGGQARFGPDVEWIDPPSIDEIDYAVDARRGDGFYAAIRSYWPALPDGALLPAYAGVRPKLAGPNAPASDFVISGPETHGMLGLVNLFGIESPGLTASLAIANDVAKRLMEAA
ncbi:FAD-dependent oxidoreductase [Parvibaculum sedimenti]|uniref:FAD-dependent oxidoreductase n=1 Tax=Parvibaculum sedimenti TaxID=2608632 RepID=A0A6N6VGU5_9HYPH|nr:NAD(P)/FAD-dependent oxidoreductase [Parvibaculum sedimenti]KAB7739139.1 FAD-dependent oxidoreductase [Parvibaculum sedimenti]